MSSLLFLHLFFLGIWLGCVCVEAVIEIMAFRRPSLKETIALFHFYIDLLVELPTVIVVFATGLWMVEARHLTGFFGIKVVLGMVAILANFVCIACVILRKYVVEDIAKLDRYSRCIYGTFLVGVPSGLTALGIGLHYLGFF